MISYDLCGATVAETKAATILGNIKPSQSEAKTVEIAIAPEFGFSKSSRDFLRQQHTGFPSSPHPSKGNRFRDSGFIRVKQLYEKNVQDLMELTNQAEVPD